MNHITKNSIGWIYGKERGSAYLKKPLLTPKNSMIDFQFTRNQHIIDRIIIEFDGTFNSAELYYNQELVSLGEIEDIETWENRHNINNDNIKKKLVFFRDPDVEIALPISTHITPIIRLRISDLTICSMDFDIEDIPEDYIYLLEQRREISEPVFVMGQKKKPTEYSGKGNNIIIMNNNEIKLKYPIY